MAAGLRTVTRSANEVMTLAAKAARGGGAPPAQAAEFGRAVVYHLIAGRDVADLWAALDALPEGAIIDLPLGFARVLEAARDQHAEGLIPCAQTLAQSYAEALPFSQSNKPTAAGLRLSVDLSQPNAKKPVTRLDLPDDLAAHMNSLAARTFVPETEASRLSGAGAGLTDND